MNLVARQQHCSRIDGVHLLIYNKMLICHTILYYCTLLPSSKVGNVITLCHFIIADTVSG